VFIFDPRPDNQYQTFTPSYGTTTVFGSNGRVFYEWEQTIRLDGSRFGVNRPGDLWRYDPRIRPSSSGRPSSVRLWGLSVARGSSANLLYTRPVPWLFRFDPVRLITAEELATMPKTNSGPTMITGEELANLPR
jgi:hypothetical protein